jgi:hypothetical protein
VVGRIDWRSSTRGAPRPRRAGCRARASARSRLRRRSRFRPRPDVRTRSDRPRTCPGLRPRSARRRLRRSHAPGATRSALQSRRSSSSPLLHLTRIRAGSGFKFRAAPFAPEASASGHGEWPRIRPYHIFLLVLIPSDNLRLPQQLQGHGKTFLRRRRWPPKWLRPLQRS